MPSWRRYRRKLEVAFTRLGFVVIPRIPRRIIVGISRMLGRLGWYLSPHLRDVGLTNLELAYGGTLSSAQKQAILRQAFQTSALAILDIFWFTLNTRERVSRYLRFAPEIEQEILRKKAQICITAHMGNWEMVGIATAARGFPLVSVAAPLHNPRVDIFFQRVREATGQVVIPRSGAVKELLRTLRQDGKVGLLLDQNTKPCDGGVFVEFFGRKVPVSNVAGLLAVRTGAEIRFGFSKPEADGSYTVFTLPAIMPPSDVADSEAAAYEVTQLVTRRVEQAVRQEPGRWLWMYKRWKHVPPGEDPSAYPFYSKPPPRA